MLRRLRYALLRMEPLHLRGSHLHLSRKLNLARLKRQELLFHTWSAQAVLDRLDDSSDLPLDAGELIFLVVCAFACSIETVELAVIFDDELLDELRLH